MTHSSSIPGGSNRTSRFDLNGSLVGFPVDLTSAPVTFDGVWVAPTAGMVDGVWIYLNSRGVSGNTTVNLWKLPAGGGPVQVNTAPIVTYFNQAVPVFSNALNVEAVFGTGDAFYVELIHRDVSGLTEPADLTVELVSHN